MKYNEKNELPKRKELRLKKFDYNSSGAYFITVCTHNKAKILSHIEENERCLADVKLTEFGMIVDKYISEIPERFGVCVSGCVIMPNHIHLLVEVPNNIECTKESEFRSIVSKVIGYIKMNSSKEFRKKHGNATVWQRGFYDHIIRNREDYENTMYYIYENPLKWGSDSLNIS